MTSVFVLYAPLASCRQQTVLPSALTLHHFIAEQMGHGEFEVESIQSPVLMTPPQGTLIPWSVGPRVCPGQKMSQVECVAVVSTLFRKCNARPIVHGGESLQTAQARLLDMLQNSQPVLTLQISRPQDVEIEWLKRAVKA